MSKPVGYDAMKARVVAMLVGMKELCKYNSLEDLVEGRERKDIVGLNTHIVFDANEEEYTALKAVLCDLCEELKGC